MNVNWLIGMTDMMHETSRMIVKVLVTVTLLRTFACRVILCACCLSLKIKSGNMYVCGKQFNLANSYCVSHGRALSQVIDQEKD